MGAAESQYRAVFRIALTEEGQRVVNGEGIPTRSPTSAEMAVLSRATVQRYVAAYRSLDRVPMTHAEKLASLMTLNFQEFDNVSFLAA